MLEADKKNLRVNFKELLVQTIICSMKQLMQMAIQNLYQKKRSLNP